MSKRIVVAGVILLVLIGGLAAGIYFSSREKEMAVPAGNLEAIKAKVDAQDFEAARSELEQYVAENAEDAEAQFLLGVTYFNLNDYEKARQAFMLSMELDPDRAAAVHHNLGALAYQMGDTETAVNEFQTALDIDPADADTHYQLGATYLVMAFPMGVTTPDAEYLAKSEEEFKTALDLVPGKPEALVGLGNVYLLQGQFSEAIEFLEQAVDENPTMREGLFALGRAYAGSGQTDKAKSTLQAFLDTDPPAVWAQQAQDLLAQLDR